MKFSKWTILRVLALVLVVGYIWCLNHDRLSLQNWSVPVEYLEDCPLYFSHLQAAAEGDYMPFHSYELHRLGAPGAANWNDWPSPGKNIVYFYGTLSRWLGLFPAANLSVLLAYVTSALAFYLVCRLLRFRWEWSFVGAVLFAFTYLHAYRNLHHIVHTHSYTVPFVLLSGWLVAFGRCKTWRDWRPILCLVTAAVVAIENPYNTNMFGQLICLGLLVQFIGPRRKFNLILGGGCLAVLVTVFFVGNLNTFLYAHAHGPNFECLQRGYYETELHGLKLTELVFPPLTHHIARLAGLAAAYYRDQWFIKGEPFSPYLGWVALAALLWMAWEALARLSRRNGCRTALPAYLPLVVWVLVYSMIGGLNCILGFLTSPLFRGTNRYSIYISALALLFLASRLSRLGRRWSPGTRFGLAAVILGIGLFDQLPRGTTPEETDALRQFVEADHAFAQQMEQKLPAQAMVFQLPVMAFPEGLPIGGVQSYDMLRPYIHTRTLRFSFGTDKGRTTDDWMKEVEKLPAKDLVSALEQYGFSALYINRKGYPDQGEGLLKQLAEAGCTERLADDNREQVCIRLHPSPTPQAPPESKRVLWRLTGDWNSLNTGQGGAPQMWAHADTGLDFSSPPKLGPCTYTFSGQIGSLQTRRLTIEFNGREVWSETIGAGTALPVSLHLDAKPGKNHLAFKTDLAVVPTKDNPQPRGYVILNQRLTRD